MIRKTKKKPCVFGKHAQRVDTNFSFFQTREDGEYIGNDSLEQNEENGNKITDDGDKVEKLQEYDETPNEIFEIEKTPDVRSVIPIVVKNLNNSPGIRFRRLFYKSVTDMVTSATMPNIETNLYFKPGDDIANQAKTEQETDKLEDINKMDEYDVCDMENDELNDGNGAVTCIEGVDDQLGSPKKEPSEIERVVSVVDIETVRANARFSHDDTEGEEEKTEQHCKSANLQSLKRRTLIKRGTTSYSIIKNSQNPENLELLKNLMNNKNIIIKKNSSIMPNFQLLKLNASPRKIEKRKITVRENTRMARLLKEWQEIKQGEVLPKKDILSSSSEVSDFAAEKTSTDTRESRRKPILPEVVFEESGEVKKSEEDSKLKWKNGKDTVYCKECQIFMKRSSYHNHIKFVHEKVRKYLCQTCGYAACTGTILRQHVQAVHVGYSFSCDQCPKKFNLMKRLRKHIETYHSGKPIERNHICQYCAMAFAKPGCLKRHLRSHTQETPYQCQFCQRRFKYRWPKVQHERLHTGEKPYKCSFCDERFTQNCVRKNHEYKKHGNEDFKPKERVRTKKRKISRKREKEEDTEGSSRSESGSE